MVVPQGTIDGTDSVAPGEPDIRRPFISFTESSYALSGWHQTECSVLQNVPPESYAYVRVGEVPDFYADVECGDGRGYDFYRVRWQGMELLDFGPKDTTLPIHRSVPGWGPDHPFDQPHYKGYADWVSSRTDGSTRAKFSVCGYRGGQADCFVPEDRPLGQETVIEGGWDAIKISSSRNENRSCC